jgi:DNA-binding MarR family transcriptional regulator
VPAPLAPESSPLQFPLSSYRHLAEFRSSIRRFLHFSEQAAREQGLEPQQHQLLLAVKGLPNGVRPTISSLAERLFLRHHSTVELVNRMIERGVIRKHPSTEDRREMLIELTADGERLLRRLSFLHWEELGKQAPELLHSLTRIVAEQSANRS